MASTQAQPNSSQLEALEGHDRVPELPTPSDIAASYGNAAHHNLPHPHSPSIDVDPASERHNIPLTRQLSSGSHVDIGHFDPEGVAQLRRSLSRQSHNGNPLPFDLSPLGEGERRSANSISTEVTLASPDAPFDFEKTLRNVVKK